MLQSGKQITVIHSMRTLATLPLLLFVMSMSAQDSNTSTYGNNLLTLSPFSVYGSDHVGDVFVGMTYERFINDYISIGAQTAIGIEDEGFQIGIGPKFYPSDHDKSITYGLAPTFLFTTSLSNAYYNGYALGFENYIYRDRETRVNQFGFMLMNSMNATLNEQIHFSIEGGIGVNYISDFEDDQYFDNGPDISGMLRCNMGYRF
jgi:hypothetical protein